jgi:hypothetical protein
MHGIFYAWGAGITPGKEIAQLDIIDVHPTVMSLLGLQPGNPVDGKVVSEIFAAQQDTASSAAPAVTDAQ